MIGHMSLEETSGAKLDQAVAGLLTSIILIASTVSYSAAIFSGPLSGFLQVGIGSGLIGAIVSILMFSMKSGIPFAIAGPDSKPTAILAALVIGTAGYTGMHADSGAAMAMLVLMIGTVLTGVALYAIGALRMGGLVRYVPYSVVGGFMAVSGWLLATGAIRILTGIEPRWQTLAELVQPAHLIQIAAGVAFAVALRAVGRSRSLYAFPALLLGGTALVHVLLATVGRMSIAEAQAAGWLLRVPAGAVIPTVWLLSRQLPHVDWAVLARLSGDYAALIMVTAITLLLSTTSVEVDTNMAADVDVDRELRTNGLANLLAAIPGGMVGTLSLSRTLFNFQSGGRTRISGLTAAAACLLTLAFGTGILGYLPISILGGMLLDLGAGMLDVWLIRGWKRMSMADFAQVCGILVVILWWGFLAGIAAGVAVACVTFAVNSSRVGLVKMELDRSNFSSRVDRPPTQIAELIRHGERIRIFRLHGVIFFGSANSLMLRVKEIVGEKATCSVLILDFLDVLGIDSSAVMSLIKLSQFAEREGFLIVASSVPAEVEDILRKGGLFASGGAKSWALFNDLDAALEWSEEYLLGDLMSREEALRSADEWLVREIGSRDLFQDFTSYLETVEYAAGDTLFEQNAPTDSLVLLHSGRVSVIFRGPDGHEVRVRSMLQQTMVGEMGLYRTRPRGASVIVDRPTVVYSLTAEALEQIEQDNPPLAYAFHKFVIRTLADRLDFANREIAGLEK